MRVQRPQPRPLGFLRFWASCVTRPYLGMTANRVRFRERGQRVPSHPSAERRRVDPFPKAPSRRWRIRTPDIQFWRLTFYQAELIAYVPVDAVGIEPTMLISASFTDWGHTLCHDIHVPVAALCPRTPHRRLASQDQD